MFFKHDTQQDGTQDLYHETGSEALSARRVLCPAGKGGREVNS